MDQKMAKNGTKIRSKIELRKIQNRQNSPKKVPKKSSNALVKLNFNTKKAKIES